MLAGEGNGTPLQYSCLENPMDRGAWWAAVHGVAKSRTWLSDFTFTFHFHALEKEMATHSSVLGWRTPGIGEPGGLPSMGSQRVGHDLAAVHVGYRQRYDLSPMHCLFSQASTIVSLALLSYSLGCKFPLSLTINHCHQSLPPLPCCGATLQCRWGCHGLSACISAWAAVK